MFSKQNQNYFTAISKFILNLSNIDVASDEIERRINPRTNLFRNITEFTVNDKSSRGTFGIFLGLLKNLRCLKKLTLRTKDRNINVILEECLKEMTDLEEIHLTSNAPRHVERFRIIRDNVPGLKKISVYGEHVEEARKYFSENITLYEIDSR